MKFFFVLGIVLILFGLWGFIRAAWHGKYYNTSIITTYDCVLAGFVLGGVMSECIAAFIWAFTGMMR